VSGASPGADADGDPTPRQVALIEALGIHPGPPPLRGTRHLALSFPSAFVHADDAATLVIGRMRSWSWLAQAQAELLAHALHEALTNAVVHGNRGRLELSVAVDLWADEHAWDLHVTDQGKGFTQREVMRAFRGRRRNLGSGRGLVIIVGAVERAGFYLGGRLAVLGGHRADAAARR
jgi:anti-sigma regulatory factor (Ser/Thr protein kinase)